MVGLPQARDLSGSRHSETWVQRMPRSLSRRLPNEAERVTVEGVVPGRNFADVVFRTPARIVRVEIDPEKLYPQLISVTTLCQRSGTRQKRLATRHCNLVLRISSRLKQFRANSQRYPRLQDARILLARALLGQNKLDEAEKYFARSRRTVADNRDTSLVQHWPRRSA